MIVKNREDVEIHIGNFPSNTKGCVLLGDSREADAVDNSIDAFRRFMAHLAGALGKPVFMLNPINPCWRWLHGPAPWYSTMRIFDQVEAGNWAAPIAAIKREIEEMLAVKAALEQAA